MPAATWYTAHLEWMKGQRRVWLSPADTAVSEETGWEIELVSGATGTLGEVSAGAGTINDAKLRFDWRLR